MSDLDDLANAVSSKRRAANMNYSSPGAGRKLKGPSIICPNANCGYRGRSLRKAKGSLLTLILLFAIGVLPGILYLVFWQGYIFVCPRCGMKVLD